MKAERGLEAIPRNGTEARRREGRETHLLMDVRSVQVACRASAAFGPIRRIGGRTGWYYGNWLWRLRGFIDVLVGGVGLGRGRRDPEHLARGDVVDCWQVEEIEPDQLLRLGAQMKLPGRGWLQFEVEERGASATIRQTALFEPVGFCGRLYWYALYPLHKLIFAGMLRQIARVAEVGEKTTGRSGLQHG